MISLTELRKSLVTTPDRIDEQFSHPLVGEKTNAAVKEPDDNGAHGYCHVGAFIFMPVS